MPRRAFAVLLVAGLGLAALLVVNGALVLPAPIVRAEPAQSPNACIPISSDITTNTTWSADCYHVTTDTVAIQPGAMLTIAPTVIGTRIEFEADARLLVIGNLQALGDPAHLITFTSAGAQTPRAWQGITFDTKSPDNFNVIRYSTIEYARTGILIGGARYLHILSNTLRFNGDASSLEGGIGGITDWTEVKYNNIYSNSNGIALNKSFYNTILGNAIHDNTGYGIIFAEVASTLGGSDNTIRDNMIYRTQQGLRLEDGSRNQVLTNSLTLNTDDAIYLDRQSSVAVTYNHIYTNGGGTAYRGSIFITGSNSRPFIQHNVILDDSSDAVAFDTSTANLFNDTPMVNNANALCATSGYELRNSSTLNVNASNNWWGTNTPQDGDNYTGPVVPSNHIMLSVTLGANRLPADASATTIVTVTLRDSLNNTVPGPNRPGDPNARRIALQTTPGNINPEVVVDDHGVVTTVLTAVPQVGVGLITATAFCNYPLTATYEITYTNVAIAKTSPVTQTTAGSLLTYTMAYSNPSSIDAPNVVITDVLDAKLAYAGDTSGHPANRAGNIITWTIGTLPSGASRSFVLTTAVSSVNALCGQELTNAAAISTSALESTVTDNNRVAPPISVICPNLAITKTKTLAPVYAGDLVTYTITYRNSTAAAANVVISDVLPPGMSYVGDTSGFPATVTGNQISWSIGTVMPDISRSFILTASIPLISSNCRWFGPNMATISTSSVESTTTDNSSAAYSFYLICADWDIAKRAVRPSGPSNAVIEYTLVYTNNSDVILSGATITDRLPANTVYLTDTSGLPITVSGNLLTWSPVSMSPHASTSFSLSLKYTGTDNNVVSTNTACISMPLFDRDPSNNCSQAVYRIISLVDIVVVKDDDVGPTDSLRRAIGHKSIAYAEIQQTRKLDGTSAHRPYVSPGDIVTYTIAVVNVSAYTSTNFILTETLPLYTQLHVTDGWTFAGGRTYTQALGNLYPGTGRVLYFVTKVYTSVPPSVPDLINAICGFGSESDRTPDDNCHIEDTPLIPYVKVFLPLILRQADFTLPAVSFTSATYHVFEDEPTALITVTLDKPWNEPVRVKYHTEDGSATAGLDYTATQGILTFTPTRTMLTFTVSIINDTLREYWETAELILSDQSDNARIGYPGVATLTIEDVPCPVPMQSLMSLYSPMDVAYDAPTDRLFIANRDGIAGGSVSVTHLSPIQHLANITGVLSAQGLVQDVARQRLYVVGWDWLNVLDASTYTKIATVTLGSGVGAHSVAYNPVNQKIYVTGFSDNSITIIDANTLQIRARLGNSSERSLYEPSYIAVNTSTGKVYVTNHAHGRPIGWVTVVSGSTDQIVNAIYLHPAGELYGTRRR